MSPRHQLECIRAFDELDAISANAYRRIVSRTVVWQSNRRAPRNYRIVGGLLNTSSIFLSRRNPLRRVLTVKLTKQTRLRGYVAAPPSFGRVLPSKIPQNLACVYKIGLWSTNRTIRINERTSKGRAFRQGAARNVVRRRSTRSTLSKPARPSRTIYKKSARNVALTSRARQTIGSLSADGIIYPPPRREPARRARTPNYQPSRRAFRSSAL